MTNSFDSGDRIVIFTTFASNAGGTTRSKPVSLNFVGADLTLLV